MRDNGCLETSTAEQNEVDSQQRQQLHNPSRGRHAGNHNSRFFFHAHEWTEFKFALEAYCIRLTTLTETLINRKQPIIHPH